MKRLIQLVENRSKNRRNFEKLQRLGDVDLGVLRKKMSREEIQSAWIHYNSEGGKLTWKEFAGQIGLKV